MLYPTLSPEQTSRDFIDVFGGYNHNLRIQDNEFYDMENMSSSKYPLLSSRSKRGDAAGPPLGKTCGALYRSAFYLVSYVGSTIPPTLRVYKDGTEIAQFSTGIVTSYVQRKLVMMGAYLVILPDKVYVNTANPTEYGAIDNEVTTDDDTISIQPCMDDGSSIRIDYVGSTEPSTLRNGYVWLDTSVDPPSLKQYYTSNSTWQSVISNYVKFKATTTDISDGFSEGDGVDISGAPDGLNGVSIIKKIPDSTSLVVTGQLEASGLYQFFEPAVIPYRTVNTVRVYCESTVVANYFQGKRFVIGDNTVLCTANTVAVEHSGLVPTDTIQLTNQTRSLSNPLSSRDYDQENASSVYVKLDTGEELISTAGQYVRFGEDKTPYFVVTDTTQSGIQPYLRIHQNYSPNKASVKANTPIYPLADGHEAGVYETTLTFEKSVKIDEKTKIILATDQTITRSAPVTFSRKMPQLDYVIENQNRLWGCRYGANNAGDTVNEIYCCKLGDFKNWQCFEGVSTDSYVASCGTDGAWTGAISFASHPIFFKENYIHTVYGSYPAQYQINSVSARGVQNGSAESLAILNETLFYMSPEGVCTYNGSLPINISNAFGDIRYHGAVGCAYNGKYYIDMLDGANTPVLMVYDAKRDLWHKEDDLATEWLCAVSNDVYYCLSSGDVRSLFGGTDTAPVPWFVETGEYGLSMPDSKYISRLNLRLALDRGANVMISIQYDSSGIWEKLCNIVRSDLKPFTLPIKPRRCDHFRMKLEGKGGVRIYSISKTISQGSDRS